MKPELMEDDGYTFWHDADSPISQDPDDGYKGISDKAVEGFITRLTADNAELKAAWQRQETHDKDRIERLTAELEEWKGLALENSGLAQALEAELAEEKDQFKLKERFHAEEVARRVAAEKKITRLTAELAKSERVAKFWADELIGSKAAINGLLAELAEAKEDNAALWEDRNTLLVFINSGGTQEDIRAALDAAKQRRGPLIKKEE